MKHEFATTVIVLLLAGSRADAGSIYTGMVLGQNPIAYYQLNETTGTVATDLVTSRNGTFGSALTLEQVGPRPPEFMGFDSGNRSVQFNRDDFSSVISLPTTLGMSSNIGSVSMWFNITAEQAQGRNSFLFYGNADTSGDGFGSAREQHVYISAEGRLAFFIRSSDPNKQLLELTSPDQGNFANGNWHHLAFTWDRNDAGDNAARLYADGIELISATHDAANFSFSEALQLGRPTSIAGGLKRVFGGQLDEVGLFNRTLSAAEVRDQFDSAVVPEPASLVLAIEFGLFCGGFGWWRRKSTFRTKRVSG